MLVFLGLATSVLHAQLWEEVVLAEGHQGLIRQVVVGDFDLDGDLDLVRVTPEGLYLHVAAPAGDLGDAMTLKAVEHWRVVVGDLDLDGDLDLVTLEGDRSIHWHAGDGMGGFVEMAEILAASTQNVLFGLGDLDQDGDLDLVISTAAEGLAWLAGDGSGAFSAAVGLVPPPFYPSGLSIVDVDLDGLLDLVWHRELAGAKVQQAMFGLGGGAFSPELTLTSDGYTQNRFRVADLTGDSLPDLLTFGNQNQEVVLLSRNLGGGMFEPRDTLIVVADDVRALAIADADGDEDLDLIIGRYPVLEWHVNDGMGGFSSTIQVDSLVWSSILLAPDLNGDGSPDIISVRYGDCHTYKADGQGDWGRADLVGSYVNDPVVVSVADVIVDGIPDVLFAGYIERTLGLVPMGPFAQVLDQEIPVQIDVGAIRMMVADVNGDGLEDMLQSLEYTPIVAYVSDGTGGFERLVDLDLGPGDAGNFDLGDLDGDGDLDVAGTSPVTGWVNWMANDGQGNFNVQTTLDNFPDPNLVRVGDLNGDGIPDIFFGVGQGLCAFYPGLGGGQFGPYLPFGMGVPGISTAVLADLDVDGDLDVVCGAPGSGRIDWFPNDGGGQFPQRITLEQGLSQLVEVRVADMDGDGLPDVVRSGGAALAWSKALGGGLFQPSETIGQLFDAQNMDIRDIDLDGDLDVVVADNGADRIVLYKNRLDEVGMAEHDRMQARVWPDPVVGGVLHWSGFPDQVVRIVVHDGLGREVLGASSRLGQVSVEGLSSGTYVVRGVDATGTTRAAVSFIVP